MNSGCEGNSFGGTWSSYLLECVNPWASIFLIFKTRIVAAILFILVKWLIVWQWWQLSWSTWDPITTFCAVRSLHTSFISQVPKVRKSRLGSQWLGFWGRNSFWISTKPWSHYFLIEEREGEKAVGQTLSLDSSSKALTKNRTSLDGQCSHRSHYLPKDPSPNAIILENRSSACGFEKEINIGATAVLNVSSKL